MHQGKIQEAGTKIRTDHVNAVSRCRCYWQETRPAKWSNRKTHEQLDLLVRFTQKTAEYVYGGRGSNCSWVECHSSIHLTKISLARRGIISIFAMFIWLTHWSNHWTSELPVPPAVQWPVRLFINSDAFRSMLGSQVMIVRFNWKWGKGCHTCILVLVPLVKSGAIDAEWHGMSCRGDEGQDAVCNCQKKRHSSTFGWY